MNFVWSSPDSSDSLPLDALYACLGVSLVALVCSFAALGILASQTPPPCDCQSFLYPDPAQQAQRIRHDVPSLKTSASNEMYGAEFYPSLQTHVYVPDEDGGNTFAIRPSAVFYGDVVIMGGSVRTVNVNPTPPVEATEWINDYTNGLKQEDRWQERRDTYKMGVGRCGLGLLHGGVVEYTKASQCSLQEFEEEREVCCWSPSLCARRSDTECGEIGRFGSKEACDRSGCCFSQTENLCLPCSQSKCTWTSLRSRNNTENLSVFRDKQRIIYKKNSESRRKDMDRPSYYMKAHKLIEPGGLSYALVKRKTGAYLSNLVRSSDPNEASARFDIKRAHAPVPLQVTVYDDPIPIDQTSVDVLDLSFSIVGVMPSDFSGSLSSLNGDFKRTIHHHKWPVTVVSKGLLDFTMVVEIQNDHYVLVPSQHAKIGNIDSAMTPLEGCSNTVQEAVSCFRQPNADQELCASRANTDHVRRCCNEAAQAHLYVECLH